MALKVVGTQALARSPMKVMLYGDKGVGKSRLALQFPRPLLLIDTERGIDCLARQFADQPDIDIAQSNDWSEITSFLQDIKHGRAKSTDGKRSYKSVVIDPLTPLYVALVNTFLIKNDRGMYQRGKDPWFDVKHNWSWLAGLLASLHDCNLVCTSHAKDLYDWSSSNRQKAGYDRPDLDDSILYLFDLVLELARKDGKYTARLSPFKPDRNGRLMPNHVLTNPGFGDLERIFYGDVAKPASAPVADPKPLSRGGTIQKGSILGEAVDWENIQAKPQPQEEQEEPYQPSENVRAILAAYRRATSRTQFWMVDQQVQAGDWTRQEQVYIDQQRAEIWEQKIAEANKRKGAETANV